MLSSSVLPATIPATSPPANASLLSVSITISKDMTSLPCTSGIVDFAWIDWVNWIFLDFYFTILLSYSNNCWIGSLGDNGNSLSLGVFLWKFCKSCSNLRYRCRCQSLRFTPGGCFGLVTDDIVPIRGGLRKRVLEELGDEGCRNGQYEDLCYVRYCLNRLPKLHTLSFFAASSAKARIAGGETVK